MNEPENHPEAFKRFMAIVTGPSLTKQMFTDRDEAKISDLEQQVNAIQRSVHRAKARRKAP